MKKILLTSYTLNPSGRPDKTAEWKTILQIARHQKVIVITRTCYREAIAQYMQEPAFSGRENMSIYYFDGFFIGRNSSDSFFHYYLWQMAVVGFIRKEKVEFDYSQDINLHNSWIPTFLWRLGKPLVWGPLGHQPIYRGEYIRRFYGSLYFYRHCLKWKIKNFLWKSDPFLQKTKQQSSRIISGNSSIAAAMKLPGDKNRVMPAFGAEPPEPNFRSAQNSFEILSIGSFTAINGFDLTIKSFARFYKALPPKRQLQTRLTLVGSGPCETRLKELIAAKGIIKAVRLLHWPKPSQIKHLYASSSLFFLPSHDGTGRGIPEALAYGLPILCFDNNGPGEYVAESCGRKVAYGQYENTVDHFTAHLHDLFVDKALCRELSEGARLQFEKYFTWDRKGEIFRQVYQELMTEKETIQIYTS